MDRADQLIHEYSQAQEEIIREVEKEPKGTEREYSEKLLAKITAILVGLYAFTERWSKDNIPKLYEEDMDSSYRDVASQYRSAGKTAPNMAGSTIIDSAAIRNAQTNINTYLNDAIESTRRRMQTEIRQAAFDAANEAITKGQSAKVLQRNLIERLEKMGVSSVAYQRNGKTCYMQLDAYAELVARTTVHEIRNTANLNLGARIGNDLVKVSEHFGACPICTPYQGRVFSVSGNNPSYPYLYSTPFSNTYQNFHPRCRHVITQYIEDLHTPEENAKMQEFSKRSYDVGGDGWTKAQTKEAERSLANYRAGQDRKRRVYTDRKQYQRYQLVLGDDAPKTFSVFRRMKAANSERWQITELDYRRRNRLISNPELALPNAERATAANSKFTSYLFGGNNADGLAKGRAFESRLGYNIHNWKELQKQLLDRAQLYPATAGEVTEFGIKYTQLMVLYGNKGTPANTVVGWIVNEEKTRLTSAYIKEVK